MLFTRSILIPGYLNLLILVLVEKFVYYVYELWWTGVTVCAHNSHANTAAKRFVVGGILELAYYRAAGDRQALPTSRERHRVLL